MLFSESLLQISLKVAQKCLDLMTAQAMGDVQLTCMFIKAFCHKSFCVDYHKDTAPLQGTMFEPVSAHGPPEWLGSHWLLHARQAQWIP